MEEGTKEIGRECNFIGGLFVDNFMRWAKEHNVEPQHLICIADWGLFTSVSNTNWTSAIQLEKILINAHAVLNMRWTKSADAVNESEIPKELQS